INARRLSITSINDLRQRHGSVRDFWTCMFLRLLQPWLFSAVVHTSKSAAGVSLENKQQGIERDRCIALALRANDTSDAERVFHLHLGEVVFLKSAHEGWWVLRCYRPPVSAQAGASTGAANSPPRILRLPGSRALLWICAGLQAAPPQHLVQLGSDSMPAN